MADRIARFNPRTMSDQAVIGLATGRAGLVGSVLEAVESNRQGRGPNRHRDNRSFLCPDP